jgi:hypothetical protein
VKANGKVFVCEVGVAHYTPPELQRKPLRGLVRTENHDRFGLAVLIYQLLFVGRHPYAGVYGGPGDPSFEEMIADFRFAQGPEAHRWHMKPPPYTPTFDDIPSEIGDLFRRAFERGSEAGNRPAAAQWHTALHRLEQNVVKCRTDQGHLYWNGAASCIWCRLGANGGPEYFFGVAGDLASFTVDEAKLKEVLTRLEATRRIDFKYSRDNFSSRTPRSPAAIPASIADLRERLQNARRGAAKRVHNDEENAQRQHGIWNARETQARDSIKSETIELERKLDGELKQAQDAVNQQYRQIRKWEITLAVIALLGVASIPFLSFIGIGIAAVFGIWFAVQKTRFRMTPDYRRFLAIRRRKTQVRNDAKKRFKAVQQEIESEREEFARSCRKRRRKEEAHVETAQKEYERAAADEVKKRRNAFRNAEQRLTDSEKKWAAIANEYSKEYQKTKTVVAGRVPECRVLSSQYEGELKRLSGSAEATARLRHLRLYSIADAEIPKIGAGRKQVLASYTVYTAADVDEARIRRIAGFGNVLTGNLLTWKQDVLRQFRFNPTTAVSSTELRSLIAKFRNRQQQILSEIEQQTNRFTSLGSTYEGLLNKVVPEIRQALADYEQAEADLSVLAT